MGATFDGSSFNRLIGNLLTVGGPGSNAEAAFRGEVASLLDVAMRYTPAATDAKIRERAEYRFGEKYGIRGAGDLKLTYNDGSRKGAAVADYVWLRSGGKFHIMRGPGRWGSRSAPGGAHWPDWLWAQFHALENQTPEERARLKKAWIDQARLSRGLAKASWLEIAQALGLDLPSAPDYVRRAKASDGQVYVNGAGQQTSTQESLVYELSNRMPALAGGGLDGAGILARAVATRERAFEIALEKGVFQDIEQVARRYPGLLTLTR